MRPATFESGGARLAGVLGEAEGEELRGGVALVHGWSGYRIGPHRILTRTARRLNAAGYTTLHFDLRGRGDSEGEYERTDLDMMIADTQRAMAFLRAEAGCETVSLLGICSGANVALGAATLESDVPAVVAWSALPFQKQAEGQASVRRKANLAAYARKLLRPATWAKLLTGRVRFDLVGKALKADGAATADGRNLKDSSRDILADLATYRGRILFVHGDRDAEGMAGRKHFMDFCGENGVDAEFHLVEGANHSFYSLAWEAEIAGRSIRFLDTAHEDSKTP